MRAANWAFLLFGLGAVAACRNNQAEQNITITDNIPANADIEALPPDESSATPTNELENGSDNADVTDLDAPSNSY
jgi:hypothetical protein